MHQNHKTPIIILHGWKLQGAVYQNLVDILRRNEYIVYSWDMPGFGSEHLPFESYTLSDYANFIVQKMEKEHIVKAIFIGHSFGGRVALQISQTYPERIAKIILTGVPVVRNTSFLKKVQFFVAKLGSRFFSVFPKHIQGFFRKILYRIIGEHDYYNAGSLKKVFQNVVSIDLVPFLKNAKSPIVCIWGTKDTFVPVSMMTAIKKIRPDVVTEKLSGLGHSPLRDNPDIYFNAIKKYL